MATQKKRIRSGFSCNLCKEKITKVDFKDVETLKKYLTDYGRITSRFANGNCAKCQRKIAKAITKTNKRIKAINPIISAI